MAKATKAPETPAIETPAIETPAIETPAIETPAIETPAIETPAIEQPKAPEPVFGGKEVFQEWKAEVKTDKETGTKSFEKLKQVRESVKITPEQAELLNEGLLYGGNGIVNAYFRPE